MNTTTIYVPVSFHQAEWSFLNREEAFRRLFDTSRDALICYRHRDDAIAAGRRKLTFRFAVVRITMSATVHELLAHQGDMKCNTTDSEGAELWTITPAGSAHLALPENADMTMEVVAPAVRTDAQPAGQTRWEPVGPTGFGC